MKATARAHPNIALVKYWGKRDHDLNLPAASSLSLTLAGLSTTTTVRFNDRAEGGGADRVTLDGALQQGRAAARVSAVLDIVRDLADLRGRPAEVDSVNDFPTAAGLASSASGFAALVTAATAAAGLELEPQMRSVLARRGSGSAARSIFGGFVRMNVGVRDDGLDAYAEMLHAEDHWDLRCLIAVTVRGPKAVSSTAGMNLTAETSPYFQAWLEDVPRAMAAAEDALAHRDFEALAAVSEASCLRMHASAIAADPGVLYWRGATVELIHALREARARGLAAFLTIDAGPHLKVFCLPQDLDATRELLGSSPHVVDLIEAHPGPGAEVLP